MRKFATRIVPPPNDYVLTSSGISWNVDQEMGDGGFEVLRILPGLWAQHPGLAVNEQDLMLLRPTVHY